MKAKSVGGAQVLEEFAKKNLQKVQRRAVSKEQENILQRHSDRRGYGGRLYHPGVPG